MPTLQEVQKQIAKNVDNAIQYLEQKEITRLPNILHREEEVKRIIKVENGFLIATNKRLILLQWRGIFLSRKLFFVEFPYEEVSTIEFIHTAFFRVGGHRSRIKIFSSGKEKIVYPLEKKARVEAFCNFIKKDILFPKAQKVPQGETKKEISNNLQTEEKGTKHIGYWALLSLIFGILSLLPLPFVHVLAIIFGVIGIKKKENKAFAIAGIVLGGSILIYTIIYRLAGY